MQRFRLDGNRSQTKPDRRLGIKLERADGPRGLAGKLDAYVPPELRYEYKPPSVFARYKALTAVFIALLLGLLGFWLSILILHHPPQPLNPGTSRSAVPVSPTPKEQPIYIEPLPAK